MERTCNSFSNKHSKRHTILTKDIVGKIKHVTHDWKIHQCQREVPECEELIDHIGGVIINTSDIDMDLENQVEKEQVQQILDDSGDCNNDDTEKEADQEKAEEELPSIGKDSI